MGQLDESRIIVNETLWVEASLGVLPNGPGVWVERDEGGVVSVELEEIPGLILALTEAKARLTARLRGEDYEDTPF